MATLVALRLIVFGSLLIVSQGFSPTSTAFIKPNSGEAATTLLMSTTETSVVDEVKVGDSLPDVVLKEKTADMERPVEVKLLDLIKGKKVAIFGIPGAFTPGCSKSHLPSFMNAQDELKAKGVELTICVATNDAYVMDAWGSTTGGVDAGIRFLSDSDADLTKALGLVKSTPVMIRTTRFSLIADDGVVTHYFSSAKESSDTWAPKVLAAL